MLNFVYVFWTFTNYWCQIREGNPEACLLAYTVKIYTLSFLHLQVDNWEALSVKLFALC